MKCDRCNEALDVVSMDKLQGGGEGEPWELLDGHRVTVGYMHAMSGATSIRCASCAADEAAEKVKEARIRVFESEKDLP